MLFSLLKTARLLRLFRAARKLDRNYEYMTSLLFLMLMFFMLVAHWMACIWYAIGSAEVEEHKGSWLLSFSYAREMELNFSNPNSGPSIKSRYLCSLYFVMTLCTTVGFGNVAAVTDAELVFSICCMLMGGKCVLLGYLSDACLSLSVIRVQLNLTRGSHVLHKSPCKLLHFIMT